MENYSYNENIIKARSKVAFREEMLNYLALNCKENGVSNEKYSDSKIIVSLTSYGKRLNQVYLTIESLMQQSLKPNRIILWLDFAYQNRQISRFLQKQMDRGLEVFYSKDIHSYKKLIPALQLYPDDVIITVDDDVYYHSNVMENLVSGYWDDPGLIWFNRGHKMMLKDDRSFADYREWEWCMSSSEVSPFNFPTGVGGVLYPPGCFSEEVFNENVFLSICPYADDVWFKAMALLHDTQSKKAPTFSRNGEDYLENSAVQDVALYHRNIGKRLNDMQIKAVFQKYDLFSKFI
jgi:hypothetical protein